MSKPSSIIIRWSLSALFLWFGTQQLLNPSMWIGFLPAWTGYFPIPGEMLVQLNGWMEVVLAISMAAGIFTRHVAAILGGHLLFIAISVGGAIGVRDMALAAVTLALAFSAPDAWSLDSRLDKKPAATKVEPAERSSRT